MARRCSKVSRSDPDRSSLREPLSYQTSPRTPSLGAYQLVYFGTERRRPPPEVDHRMRERFRIKALGGTDESTKLPAKAARLGRVAGRIVRRCRFYLHP